MLKPNSSVLIRPATLEDIPGIYSVEEKVSSEFTRTERKLFYKKFNVFPEGLQVALKEEEVVGYGSAIRWERENIKSVWEMAIVEPWHIPAGRNLFIEFLGVLEENRGQGIASGIVGAFEEYARREYMNKIQLISPTGRLMNHYSKTLGFEVKNGMPLVNWGIFKFVPIIYFMEKPLAK